MRLWYCACRLRTYIVSMKPHGTALSDALAAQSTPRGLDRLNTTRLSTIARLQVLESGLNPGLRVTGGVLYAFTPHCRIVLVTWPRGVSIPLIPEFADPRRLGAADKTYPLCTCNAQAASGRQARSIRRRSRSQHGPRTHGSEYSGDLTVCSLCVLCAPREPPSPHMRAKFSGVVSTQSPAPASHAPSNDTMPASAAGHTAPSARVCTTSACENSSERWGSAPCAPLNVHATRSRQMFC